MGCERMCYLLTVLTSFVFLFLLADCNCELSNPLPKLQSDLDLNSMLKSWAPLVILIECSHPIAMQKIYKYDAAQCESEGVVPARTLPAIKKGLVSSHHLPLVANIF